ncbi:MAG: tRNA pseudouridine(55) synthase TruB [Armatimonadetes bacterium]|nr:tRNA pseudouridine(55) synthase TruB [Armatimonadota bacterium]
MLGFLLVDKPLGWSSHDAVAKVRARLNTKRVGHSGTLDPLATGLLVIAVGHATRFLNYLDLEPKGYLVEATFGSATTTYDLEGEVTQTGAVPERLEAKIQSVLPRFLGDIEQLPPLHSAVKVGGQKLYQYARRGDTVEIPVRKVTISSVSIAKVADEKVTFQVDCGGGTFVRSLVHDIGHAIGCPAHVSGLRRTRLGEFHADNAKDPSLVTADDLLPMTRALANITQAKVGPEDVAGLRHGRMVASHTDEVGDVLLLDQNGEAVALAWCDGNLLRPKIVIPIGDRDPQPPAG